MSNSQQRENNMKEMKNDYEIWALVYTFLAASIEANFKSNSMCIYREQNQVLAPKICSARDGLS